jgi:hypothetical protein
MAQINEHIPFLCQTPCDYLLRDDPVSMAECSLLVNEYYDVSLLMANLDVYNIDAEAMGQKMSYQPNRYPDIDRTDYLIKTPADLDKIRFGGLHLGRYPYLLNYIKTYKAYTGFYPSPDACAPWSLAANIFGVERLALASISDPKLVHDMFRRIVHDLLVPMYRETRKLLPDRLQFDIADAFASPPLLSPKVFREFVVRYYDEMCQVLADDGFKFSIKGVWGISRIPEKWRANFTDDLIHVGAGVLAAMDPDVELLGPRWYRDYATNKMVALCLGLSTNLLETGPLEEIISRCKNYALVGRDGPTPMVFFLINVAPATAPERVHTAIAAIRTYGQAGSTEDSPFEIPKRQSFDDFVRSKRESNPDGFSFEWLQRSKLAA